MIQSTQFEIKRKEMFLFKIEESYVSDLEIEIFLDIVAGKSRGERERERILINKPSGLAMVT